jgi:hypothetical protein
MASVWLTVNEENKPSISDSTMTASRTNHRFIPSSPFRFVPRFVCIPGFLCIQTLARRTDGVGFSFFQIPGGLSW